MASPPDWSVASYDMRAEVRFAANCSSRAWVAATSAASGAASSGMIAEIIRLMGSPPAGIVGTGGTVTTAGSQLRAGVSTRNGGLPTGPLSHPHLRMRDYRKVGEANCTKMELAEVHETPPAVNAFVTLLLARERIPTDLRQREVRAVRGPQSAARNAIPRQTSATVVAARGRACRTRTRH